MVLVSLAACGGGESAGTQSGSTARSTEGEVKLMKTSMPTAWDETHGYTQALIAMNAYLDEVSGGTLQLDIYPGAQLGDEISVFESMQMGTIDCAIFNAASLSNFTHVLEAFDLAYLWVDESGYADTELQNTVVSSDFAPSIKLRSMTAQMHLDMYTAMGCAATPLGYSEVYNAMQTGVVDGFEDTACSTVTAGTYQTAKYVVKSGHATASPLFVCSGLTWDTLKEEEQQWLTEAVVKGREASYDTYEAAQENAYKVFADAGLEISTIDHDEALAACAPVIVS